MKETLAENKRTIPLSILDLVPILSGKTAMDSFKNSLDLARKAEQFGYKRYWMAEHHNMAGIASSATSILIGYIAGGTSSIRVGSGGIMLPNHAPLVIAEQFGTLESLYPGRIDLGIGRAPGTDQLTARALRRDVTESIDDFPRNLDELRTYLSAENSISRVRAVPGEGLDIPIWLLGSSTFSAQLAAMLGLPFAFASHFAPRLLHTSLKIYRDTFQPSEFLQKPYAMAGINVIAADTDEDAELLASSLYSSFLNVLRGTPNPLKPPVSDMDVVWSPSEKYAVLQMLDYTFIGGPEKVKKMLQAFTRETEIDELIIASHIYEHEKRVRSYEILSTIAPVINS
ncbi:LLM class flavin-dependent oxidoreductase [Rubrolithibacter danxiaensis]|uniref:LLM class flavin-dependent oxidoreductase n=1 Tax=Rubrolithibacter danxiaensis TaxID=3390805 RepID=UPI003BF7A71B